MSMADLPTSLALEVATPLGMALSVQTDSVQVPSVAGEVGVLPGHVPLLAALKPGILTYREGGQMLRAAVGGGYAEATADRVRVITEYFMRKEQIDVAAAQRDLQSAETQPQRAEGHDRRRRVPQELQREYEWAQARLLLAGGVSN